jgi:hypothetical protein
VQIVVCDKDIEMKGYKIVSLLNAWKHVFVALSYLPFAQLEWKFRNILLKQSKIKK